MCCSVRLYWYEMVNNCWKLALYLSIFSVSEFHRFRARLSGDVKAQTGVIRREKLENSGNTAFSPHEIAGSEPHGAPSSSANKTGDKLSAYYIYLSS